VQLAFQQDLARLESERRAHERVGPRSGLPQICCRFVGKLWKIVCGTQISCIRLRRRDFAKLLPEDNVSR